MPENILKDIRERKDISNRSNFFIQEAIKPKVDIHNYDDDDDDNEALVEYCHFRLEVGYTKPVLGV